MVESRAVAGNNAEMSRALYPVGHSHPGKLQHVISRHGIDTGQVETVTPVTPPVTILTATPPSGFSGGQVAGGRNVLVRASVCHPADTDGHLLRMALDA